MKDHPRSVTTPRRCQEALALPRNARLPVERALLRSALSMSEDAMLLVEAPSLQVLESGPEVRELLGYGEHEIISHDLFAFVGGRLSTFGAKIAGFMASGRR